MKAVTVAFRPGQIDQWRTGGEALVSETDELAAFAAFADLEDAFEPLEALVMELATDVEHELQLRYDIARGRLPSWVCLAVPGRTRRWAQGLSSRALL